MLRLENCRLDNGGFIVRADLVIEAGHRVAVIGPSGAGKTTLIEAIAGFVPITAGTLSWQDRALTGVLPGQRPIAMLFQDGNLFPHLSVAQNVGLGIRPNLRLSVEEQEKVRAAIIRVGLQGMEDRKPAALSGGQQSRVALGRVLVQGRDLLLLDEPFAALGPALKAEMLDLVAELATETGATVLMVSHDPADARRIADQVVLVADGVAHPPMATAELLDNPPPALKAYLG
ncbi:thiamine ABC transporter ATP-binding protein [Phaeobacter gallaeciensis]|uniref:Thiamine import ATP-binding protein ThiQ n=1 Tax=Phaeobacter gallaeciensis TaxID=60890 RepID=A0AAD0EEN9_9RHOB|nr:ATP-binding cassette domain-containing protein [Phaeobacter gallaeciensis]AHD11184.1 ABC-type thiamine transport system, ATPase component [Phaeobacter gallaeciensis DSM 26640]ATE94447.1 thiamine import ATP-binding protein ThiQ [Phaeobacter gallaeciensis]ATE98720.1 thiamine import ATP-binding protein ThiQ [Phaeobacter gallaeciensis]ATF03111.1 thiamine import ATP-binding protein ThiQ [Phaeobacter gallaeciensis]ATF07491.1 thiamine import ATP-binding protein ThiQ [Phaeobacter gallaeciensis]